MRGGGRERERVRGGGRERVWVWSDSSLTDDLADSIGRELSMYNIQYIILSIYTTSRPHPSPSLLPFPPTPPLPHQRTDTIFLVA